MDRPEKPKLSLVKGLRGRIEEIEQQMTRLQRHRDGLARTQRALAEIETQLRRMADLARRAATADELTRHRLSAEFDVCRARIDLMATNCGPDGGHLLDDNLAAVREAIAALDRELRPHEE